MARPTIVGQQVVWGTDANTTYGMIQSMTTSKGAKQKEYCDDNGDTATLVTYDKHDEIQLTALCVGSTPTLPERGETFAIGGKTYYCSEASINWSNEDAASLSLSGRTYPLFASGNS